MAAFEAGRLHAAAEVCIHCLTNTTCTHLFYAMQVELEAAEAELRSLGLLAKGILIMCYTFQRVTNITPIALHG